MPDKTQTKPQRQRFYRKRVELLRLIDKIKLWPSRRGLLQMVGRRASLLKYLTRTDKERYQRVVERLSLRK